MNAAGQVSVSRARSRLSLLLIIVLFAAPVAVAWLVFYVFPDWRPSGTSNHGALVVPVRPLPTMSLRTAGGDTLDNSYFRGKWTLLYIARGRCDSHCVHRLYKLRQVRLAQGKNIDRLQRLMLWDVDGAAAGEPQDLQAKFPGQAVALLAGPQRQALVEAFVLDDKDPLRAGRLYLVDPLGNLMMDYEPDAEPRGMIKDLERLLKYSGLG